MYLNCYIFKVDCRYSEFYKVHCVRQEELAFSIFNHRLKVKFKKSSDFKDSFDKFNPFYHGVTSIYKVSEIYDC